MHIEIKHLKDMTKAEMDAFQELSTTAFGEDDGEDSIQWVESSDWHVLLWEKEMLVGHVEFSKRDITVGAKSVQVGTIGGVCTAPSTRGRGYARAALLEAHKFLLNTLEIENFFLLTGDELIPFYEKLDYRVVDANCLMLQKSGKVVYEDVMMVLSEKELPKGDIDLCGLPW